MQKEIIQMQKAIILCLIRSYRHIVLFHLQKPNIIFFLFACPIFFNYKLNVVNFKESLSQKKINSKNLNKTVSIMNYNKSCSMTTIVVNFCMLPFFLLFILLGVGNIFFALLLAVAWVTHKGECVTFILFINNSV